MNIKIITPDQVLYEDEIKLAQLSGVDGSFEILNNHAPLVALLQAGTIRIITTKSDKELLFKIKDGFVEVLDNNILVLVNA